MVYASISGLAVSLYLLCYKTWEETYEKELDNFQETGDTGEVWFGFDSVERIVNWLQENESITKQTTIIDLGCGNGIMLVELAKEGFTQLTGVDYSPKAISLAKSVADKENLSITYKVHDILSDVDDSVQCYDLCIDKGTYDAISLCPEEPLEKRNKYMKNVHGMLRENGQLILTSCNWTEEELKSHFTHGFSFHAKIPTPSFSFGGRTGNRETVLVFTKV